MLIGAHVSPAGGPPTPSRAASSAAATRSRSSTRTRARGSRPSTATSRSPTSAQAHGEEPGRRAAHPRRLPAQRRHHRQGDARQDARVAHRLAAGGRRPRRPRRRPAPRQRAGGQGRAGDQARRQGHRRGAERERALPAAPREHGGHGRDARALVPGARRPRRRRRRLQAARPVPGLLPPVRLGLRHPHRGGPGGALDECDAAVGLKAVGSLHLNDSQTPLGSNRDRHADVGEGEIGRRGCAVFLSEPRFAELPCVLETPGPNGHGPTRAQITLTRRLRGRGTRRRR